MPNFSTFAPDYFLGQGQKREWLDPSADYCRVHHSLLETVPQSIFARAPNFDAALRAISRYRCPPLRLSKTLR
ncbi:hypothetical protein B7G54_36720 [Burkholderia puraquae]|uniref:Uncharacterized protein n=1 Tax=Burkholderia puraquae TaxID=1904757 RepID=A0A1X1P5Q2_9BURK|nr:hypothetical protein B7G54_36720 [Burkholderia puraquae]